jgi:CxxC-x17-CxxC domain-containing protein
VGCKQKEEKRLRNLEYAKKFKKKKKRKPAEGKPFILMAPQGGSFPAICSRCQQETELPFRPTGTKPVYCDACYSLMRSSFRPTPTYNHTPATSLDTTPAGVGSPN